jgi:uncharacterized protein with GYD domain
MDHSLAGGAPVPAAATVREEDSAMPKYVILVNWTEQGVRNVAETAQRAEQFQR